MKNQWSKDFNELYNILLENSNLKFIITVDLNYRINK